MVGTTGFTDEDKAELARQFAGPDHGAPNCVLAANFAIGAVLMMHFAELAAPWFDGVEIVELHHDGKVDAPSGTAMQTAERMAAARRRNGKDDYPDDGTTTVVVPGVRGGRDPAVCACTRCGFPVWWPTRRCSSARWARASPSATMPTTAPRSWTEWQWRSGRCPPILV